MSNKDLNIVLLQSDIFWEDAGKNLAHFSGLVNNIQEPVDLVILPEMFSTGFTVTQRNAPKPWMDLQCIS